MNKLSINSFEDPKYDFEPSIQYISKEKEHREKIYKKFEKEGIILPDYDKFKRKRNLNKVDLLVLTEDFKISFDWLYSKWRIIIKKGACFDGSSIPSWAQIGRITKISQYSIVAALLHDYFYGLRYFERSLCDDIYECFLRYKKLRKLPLFTHMFFLRLFGGFTYNRPIEESDFCLGFSDVLRDGYHIKPYSKITLDEQYKYIMAQRDINEIIEINTFLDKTIK